MLQYKTILMYLCKVISGCHYKEEQIYSKNNNLNF